MTFPRKRNLPLSEACDSHVHIVGLTSQFPQAADRSYTAGLANLESLRALAQPIGVSRYVLVQPSFYGTDNNYLLETLYVLEGNGRGVVVVDPAVVTSRQLEEYERRGVRGVRVNFYSKVSPLASAGFSSALRRFMEILPRANWHVEIIATLPTLVSAADSIRRLTLPIVIDHYGLPDDTTPESDLGRSLLDLLCLPHDLPVGALEAPSLGRAEGFRIELDRTSRIVHGERWRDSRVARRDRIHFAHGIGLRCLG